MNSKGFLLNFFDSCLFATSYSSHPYIFLQIEIIWNLSTQVLTSGLFPEGRGRNLKLFIRNSPPEYSDHFRGTKFTLIFYLLMRESRREREREREQEGVREAERERERERETSICCSTYLCIHWLILVCALARDGTHNLSVWE